MQTFYVKNIFFDKKKFLLVEVYKILNDDFILAYNFKKQSKYINDEDLKEINKNNLEQVDRFFCEIFDPNTQFINAEIHDIETDFLDIKYWEDNYLDFVKVASENKYNLYKIITENSKINQLNNDYVNTLVKTYDSIIETNDLKRNFLANISYE
tara:strand:+ start:207 stop:668 length:462 start_codon:yes stop_codon:yes gene_type:complete